MNRRSIAWISVAMGCSLSCAFVVPAPMPTREPLPRAFAVAPEKTHPDAPTRPAAHVETPVDTPEIAAVRAELKRRRTGLDAEEIDRLARSIIEEARRHDLDVPLVMAVIYVESRFDTYAVSPAGALGIMQIMPATGEELARRHGVVWRGPQTLFDPFVNVKLGTAYLKQLLRRYDNVSTALAAYNWGPGHIDRRLRRGNALPTKYPGLVNDAIAARIGRSS